MGAYAIPDGNIRLFVNHELGKNDASQPIVGEPLRKGAFVSEFVLSPSPPRILSGDLAFSTILLNGNPVGGTFGRFCSGFLAGPQTGFDRYIYLTGEESSGSDTFDGKGGIGIAVTQGAAYLLPELGRYPKENLIVLPGTGLKTVVMGLEDGPKGLKSQLYLYIGDKKLSSTDPLARNGLAGGELYVFAAKTFGKSDESNFWKSDGPIVGTWLPVSAPEKRNDDELEKFAQEIGAFHFDRLEDGASDPRENGVFYFVSTGGSGPVNRKGRLYKLLLDVKDPVHSPAILEILLEGDAGDPTINPDNIAINSEGLMMIQEDIVKTLGNWLSDKKSALWLYDLRSRRLSKIGEVLEESWESSGIIDASEIFGPGSWLLNVQAHSIESKKASELRGSSSDLHVVEGGQLLLLRDVRSVKQ